ncbi:putative F-box only protein 6 [Iris pallida]|uniref:F-box only protein 6 n=1 Tax=Iris pallida TaxID=29817 RepID=A0AAX6HN83_IRIPA|nr:putative F-box only protein 6 [Iris pallida]
MSYIGNQGLLMLSLTWRLLQMLVSYYVATRGGERWRIKFFLVMGESGPDDILSLPYCCCLILVEVNVYVFFHLWYISALLLIAIIYWW